MARKKKLPTLTKMSENGRSYSKEYLNIQSLLSTGNWNLALSECSKYRMSQKLADDLMVQIKECKDKRSQVLMEA